MPEGTDDSTHADIFGDELVQVRSLCSLNGLCNGTHFRTNLILDRVFTAIRPKAKIIERVTPYVRCTRIQRLALKRSKCRNITSIGCKILQEVTQCGQDIRTCPTSYTLSLLVR